jgi:Protein of unknown function (DUF1638)
MRIKCLACEALARPTYLAAAFSPHIVDVEMVQRGLHNRPAHLREHLQSLVDSFTGAGYDAVTLVYGLCGQALAGLVAREVRLVIPKAHDCITLFLGSRERYMYQFENFPGTYWYSHDYIERDDGSGSSLSMGSGTDTDLEAVYEEYVSKYGKDNADYLMEAMGAWQSHYKRAVFIDMNIADASQVEQSARQEAARRGWSFERMAGDLILIRRLLNGDWDRDFLVLEPGQAVKMSYDEDIIGGQVIES